MAKVSATAGVGAWLVAAMCSTAVFGAPFMIVDGEPFWGFDRFNQLDAYLKGAL